MSDFERTVALPEPKAITARRHVCPGCRRSWAKREAALAHMERCWRVVENHACKTCAHFDDGRCCDGFECGCRGESEWTCAVHGPLRDGVAVLHCPLWVAS